MNNRDFTKRTLWSKKKSFLEKCRKVSFFDPRNETGKVVIFYQSYFRTLYYGIYHFDR